MIGRWLICLACAAVLGGCNRERRSAVDETTSPPRDAATLPIDAAPSPGAPAGDALPTTVGPPKPFDVLRPAMKRVDAQATLAAAGARTVAPPPPWVNAAANQIVYATAIPGALAVLELDDADRLRGIALRAERLDTLLAPAIARWGKVAPTGNVWLTYAWRGAGAWSAALHAVDPEYGRVVRTVPELSFKAHETPDAATAGDDLFVRLARVLGKPLEEADAALGFGVRHETPDDDERAAERTEARQGFATLRVPWNASPWQLVLRTDPTTKRVTAAVLTGVAMKDPDRVALVSALKKAFGAPRAAVSDTGRFEIEVGEATLARALDLEGRWSISVWKR